MAAAVPGAGELLDPGAGGADERSGTNPAPVLPALGDVTSHVVRAGESLPTIALTYGMAPDDLAHLNGRAAVSVLLAGTRIWVRAPRTDGESVDAAGERATPQSAADPPDVDFTEDGQQEAVVPRQYVVGLGDTLLAVSRRFDIPVEDLAAWNGMSSDARLLAGQTLLLDRPAERAAPEQTGQGSPTRSFHVVAEGETLTSIAETYSTTAALLQRQNGLADETIWAGQQLVVPRAGSGPGASLPAGPKLIEVVVSEQRMYVWQGDDLVWSWLTSTGIASHPTQRGTFYVQSKIPNAWSSAWQLWMPYWLGIYWAGSSENGIHALPVIDGQRLWAGSLGSPVSYGCIILGDQEARMLYDWAEIGTEVVVRD